MEKTEHSDRKDAKYGVYRYDTKYAFPIKNAQGNVVDVKAYDAQLLIINSSDGKKYLYDIVGIKENIVMALDLLKKQTRIGSQTAAAQHDVSKEKITQNEYSVNPLRCKKYQA